MSKKISAAEYPIAKVFNSDFHYVIPPYQRPYAWTTDEAGLLFDDLFGFYQNESEDNYFLGSIVLIKQDESPHSEVIDGQQRLTTLTILLAVLASRFSGKARIDYESYLKEPGHELEELPASPRLTLRDKEKSFFGKYIQDVNLDELVALDPAEFSTEAMKNIRANCEHLLKKSIENLPDENTVKNFSKFLVQRCYLVVVCTPTQLSAYRIFSVMNSRGMPLLAADIIKAGFIGSIAESERDSYTEKWEAAEQETGRDGFESLFGHIRMIYAKTKAKKTLLEEFNETIMPLSTPRDFIDNTLIPYADSFCVLRDRDYRATSNAKEINNLLGWLNKINNADWYPPSILFLTNKRNNPEYVLWFFTQLERLAAYMHVTAKEVNFRIDRYAKIIKEIEDNPDSDLHNPLTTLELSVDEKKSFINVLDSNIYSDLTAIRRNYIILRLDSFVSDGGASYDPKILTIEHVLPQTVNPTSEWASWWPDEERRDMWCHRIANLVPLTQRKNSAAQNYDFDRKKDIYFKGKGGTSSYALTTQVLGTAIWTEDTVKKRQEELIKMFKSGWNL